MNIQDGINHAIATINEQIKEVNQQRLAQEIQYYRSGHIITGYIDSYDFSGRLPKIYVVAPSKKRYFVPFFDIIKITEGSGF